MQGDCPRNRRKSGSDENEIMAATLNPRSKEGDLKQRRFTLLRRRLIRQKARNAPPLVTSRLRAPKRRHLALIRTEKFPIRPKCVRVREMRLCSWNADNECERPRQKKEDTVDGDTCLYQEKQRQHDSEKIREWKCLEWPITKKRCALMTEDR